MFSPFIHTSIFPDMQKIPSVLIAALIAPSVAVITWMCIPAAAPEDSADLGMKTGGAQTREAVVAATISDVVLPNASTPQHRTHRTRRTRRTRDDFPEAAPASAPDSAPSTFSTAPIIAPRFAANVPHDAPNAPLLPGERMRTLPADIAPAAQDATKPTPAPIILQMDRSLHDPVAWVENPGASTDAQAAVKARLADDFAAEISAAVKNPGANAGGIEAAWRNAKADSDWQFQKMFGNTAFNRASVGAGRAAVARQ